jgi:hypothetical protein
MKTGLELFQERTKRIRTAVALEKPDRTPVVIGSDSFAALHMGFTLGEFIKDIDRSSEIMLNSLLELGEGVDASLQTAALAIAGGPAFLSKNKLPGRELGENDLWQIDEVGLMTVEDYDVIINKGWNAFVADFLQTRIPDAAADLKVVESANFNKYATNFMNAGVVPIAGGGVMLPFDLISCGRGMANFMRDLFKRPDKVQAALEAAMPDILAAAKPALAAKPLAMMVGAPRSAGTFLSPKIWQRFVWPYFKQAVQFIVDHGSLVYMHLDADWGRDLEFFRELPAKKCIFHSDNATDIFKIKQVLGDHMCIMGDVSPAMLTIGTPDDVYKYSTRLINEIGPAGFILAEACFVPANAKLENVKAMIAAATGK